MGINGLVQFLKKREYNVEKLIPMANFDGELLSIDANSVFYPSMCIIYQQVSEAITVTDDICNDIFDLCTERWQNTVRGLHYNIISSGMYPIYIFDGDVPVEKLETVEERKLSKIKQICGTEYMQCLNIAADEPCTVQLDSKQLRNMFRFSRYIRTAFISYITDVLGGAAWQADSEADPICAALVVQGHSNVVYSMDNDMLTYGVKYMANKIIGVHFNVKELAGILEKMQATLPQFKEFCIICGCDYNKRIPRKGPAFAEKVLRGKVDLTDEQKMYLKLDRCKELFDVEQIDLNPLLTYINQVYDL